MCFYINIKTHYTQTPTGIEPATRGTESRDTTNYTNGGVKVCNKNIIRFLVIQKKRTYKRFIVSGD